MVLYTWVVSDEGLGGPVQHSLSSFVQLVQAVLVGFETKLELLHVTPWFPHVLAKGRGVLISVSLCWFVLVSTFTTSE